MLYGQFHSKHLLLSFLGSYIFIFFTGCNPTEAQKNRADADRWQNANEKKIAQNRKRLNDWNKQADERLKELEEKRESLLKTRLEQNAARLKPAQKTQFDNLHLQLQGRHWTEIDSSQLTSSP